MTDSVFICDEILKKLASFLMRHGAAVKRQKREKRWVGCCCISLLFNFTVFFNREYCKDLDLI